MSARLNSPHFDNYLSQIIDDVRGIDGVDSQPVVDTKPTNEVEIASVPDNSNTSGNVNGNGNTNGTLALKAEIMALNNGWNDKNERIVISIGENAASYKWMHERSSSMYKLINQILNVVLIVFSTGLSAETILPDNSNNIVLSVFRRIFTYVVTLISVLINFLKFEQLSEQHLNAATSFAKLYHEIQQQMCMYRRDRQNATKYVAEILKTYDNLIVNGPTINDIIIKQFKSKFENADISLPDIADKIQKIEIIAEPLTHAENTTQTTVPNNANTKNASKGLSKDEVVSNFVPNTKRYGICNLDQISQVFQIHGDISDSDIANADGVQLKELRKKFVNEKLAFEYNRLLHHSEETD